MIDVFFSEFFFIIILAFILLGPKDFLVLLGFFGRIFAKLQSYIHDLKMMFEYEEHNAKQNKDNEDKDL